jgi:two-component system LytT family response regulator
MNAIIIDDETIARQVIRTMLEKYLDSINIIGEASNVQEAISLISQLKPDLIFLDIEMQDGNGFDVLNTIVHSNIHVVFVTAFDHYALKAIKFHAFDYLLKPLDYKELINTVQRLENEVEFTSSKKVMSNYQNSSNTEDRSKHKIVIPFKDKKEFISIDQIIHLKAEKSYTWLYIEGNKKLLSSKNLGEFEKILPGHEDFDSFFFYRVHHGNIINTKFIKQYSPSQNTLLLNSGDEVMISQRRKSAFLEALSLVNSFI